MDKKRYQFTCWNSNCQQEFGITLALGETQPKLQLECPYCGAECVVDLAPYRNSVESIIRGADKTSTFDLETLDLPDIIPTRKPEDDTAESSDSDD